jgi:hypothetical protein
MLVQLAPARSRALEFGVYRDGDNNLDLIQEDAVTQARDLSAADSRIEFTIEDTWSRGRGSAHLATENYRIADGADSHHEVAPPRDMSARGELAAFVARTLDNAQRSGAAQTWVDLVNHGGGDGGGLEADRNGGVMRSDDMAGAIADGIAIHAKAHPEDGDRRIDGVIANQCLMSTLSFADALSNAGVKYLAASPETMLAPGVPSGVAEDVVENAGSPSAMARSIVDRTMKQSYGLPYDSFHPAAAFDVLDLDPQKVSAMKSAVRALDGELTTAVKDRSTRSAVLQDARAIDGMVRDDRTGLPWHADRPAIELFRTFASDGRLAPSVRTAAAAAADSVGALVMAHGESDRFEPFRNKSYADAAGPTVHFPISKGQIDPWKPAMSETDNAFFKAVGADRLQHALFG